MARAGITYSEVAKAISGLQGAGKKATIENVRQFLGTGSHSTISHHLTTWRKESELGILQQGENLPEEVLAFAKGLWQRLHEAAQTEMAQCQQQAAIKIEESRKSFIETNKILEEKKLKLHELEEALQQSGLQQEDLKKKLNETENINSKLAERVKNLERNEKQWENKYDKLHELLKNTQNNLEHYQQESQKLREQQALLVANNEQAYQLKLDEILKKYIEELNKKAYFEAELKRVEKLNSDLQADNEGLNKSITTLEEERQEIKFNLRQFKKQNEEIANQSKLQHEKLKQQENALIELKLEFRKAQEKINQLNKLLEDGEDKINVLRQDNLFLTQEKANLDGQFKQLQEMMQLHKKLEQQNIITS